MILAVPTIGAYTGKRIKAGQHVREIVNAYERIFAVVYFRPKFVTPRDTALTEYKRLVS